MEKIHHIHIVKHNKPTHCFHCNNFYCPPFKTPYFVGAEFINFFYFLEFASLLFCNSSKITEFFKFSFGRPTLGTINSGNAFQKWGKNLYKFL